jgi:hypothetical protein
MPAPAPERDSKVATSSLEERVGRRAYELYVLRGEWVYIGCRQGCQNGNSGSIQRT